MVQLRHLVAGIQPQLNYPISHLGPRGKRPTLSLSAAVPQVPILPTHVDVLPLFTPAPLSIVIKLAHLYSV